jgi:hypothetical protein
VDAGAFNDAAIMELCPPAYVGEAAYRNKGDDVRKLLEEARDFINEVDPNIKGQEIDKHYLLQRITAALAAPEPDAVEIVGKIRLGGYALNANNPDDRGPNGDDYHFILADTEAAALIAIYSRRVPMAMLEEVWYSGYAKDHSQPIANDINKAAQKYGVKIEEVGE